jgi:hypothetical protein
MIARASYRQRVARLPLKWRMVKLSIPVDAFGDRFALDDLPLPRRASGYAVQLLNTDQLLDRATGTLMPVRSTALKGLFDSFEAADAAARSWVEKHCPNPEEHGLAIVPADFDPVLKRHVLIYGVLCTQP